jgi:hypothetical protein
MCTDVFSTADETAEFSCPSPVRGFGKLDAETLLRSISSLHGDVTVDKVALEQVLLRLLRFVLFLSAFAKLQKATISFVTSVRPPARNNAAPTGQILITIYSWIFFSEIWRENSSVIKIRQNKGYFTRKRFQICDNISLISSYNEKCLKQKL